MCVNYLKRCKTSMRILSFRVGCANDSQIETAGGPSMYCGRWSNEAATVHADITADHRDVPASMFISSFLDGMWLTQEPPCRFQTT